MNNAIAFLSGQIMAKMKDSQWASAISCSGEGDGFCNFVIRSDGEIFVESGSYCSQQGYGHLNKLDATELGRVFDLIEPCVDDALGADATWLAGGPAPILAASCASQPLIDRQENLEKTRAKVIAEGRNNFVLPEIRTRIPTSQGVAEVSFKGGASAWKTFWTFETIKDVVVQQGSSIATIPAGAEVFGFMRGPMSTPALPGSSFLIPLESLALGKDDLALLSDDILSRGINHGDATAWQALLDQASQDNANLGSQKKPRSKP